MTVKDALSGCLERLSLGVAVRLAHDYLVMTVPGRDDVVIDTTVTHQRHRGVPCTVKNQRPNLRDGAQHLPFVGQPLGT